MEVRGSGKVRSPTQIECLWYEKSPVLKGMA